MQSFLKNLKYLKFTQTKKNSMTFTRSDCSVSLDFFLKKCIQILLRYREQKQSFKQSAFSHLFTFQSYFKEFIC